METLRVLFDFIGRNLPIVTVVVTISLAFVGYIATYINARILARNKDQLELVTKRLNEFYGPLFVANHAGEVALDSLLQEKLKKPGDADFPGPTTPQEELNEWFLWMKTVFMPLNDIRERIIIEKAHLIIEEKMPDCLLQFVSHVVGWKAVLAKWEKGDFEEKLSIKPFPEKLNGYVSKRYDELKAEQTRLLKSL